MPKGPQGQKRPADVIGNAVRVMQIATGQMFDAPQGVTGKNMAAAELGRMGGKARAENLSKRKLKEIAEKGAAARWNKSK